MGARPNIVLWRERVCDSGHTLSLRAYGVAHTLAQFMDSDTLECRASFATLGRRTAGISVDTVRRAINEIEAAGLVRVTRGRFTGSASCYTGLLDDGSKRRERRRASARDDGTPDADSDSDGPLETPDAQPWQWDGPHMARWTGEVSRWLKSTGRGALARELDKRVRPFDVGGDSAGIETYVACAAVVVAARAAALEDREPVWPDKTTNGGV